MTQIFSSSYREFYIAYEPLNPTALNSFPLTHVEFLNLNTIRQYRISIQQAYERYMTGNRTQNRDPDNRMPLEKFSSNSFTLNATRTCAVLSRPPVDPPKIGEGVSGFRVGSTQGALGAAAAGAAGAASALTTTDARLETGATARQTAEREDATGVLMRLQMAIPRSVG